MGKEDASLWAALKRTFPSPGGAVKKHPHSAFFSKSKLGYDPAIVRDPASKSAAAASGIKSLNNDEGLDSPVESPVRSPVDSP